MILKVAVNEAQSVSVLFCFARGTDRKQMPCRPRNENGVHVQKVSTWFPTKFESRNPLRPSRPDSNLEFNWSIPFKSRGVAVPFWLRCVRAAGGNGIGIGKLQKRGGRGKPRQNAGRRKRARTQCPRNCRRMRGEGTQNQIKLVRDFKRNLSRSHPNSRRIPHQILFIIVIKTNQTAAREEGEREATSPSPPCVHRTTTAPIHAALPLRSACSFIDGRSGLLLRPPRQPPPPPPRATQNPPPPGAGAATTDTAGAGRLPTAGGGRRASSRRGRRWALSPAPARVLPPRRPRAPGSID